MRRLSLPSSMALPPSKMRPEFGDAGPHSVGVSREIERAERADLAVADDATIGVDATTVLSNTVTPCRRTTCNCLHAAANPPGRPQSASICIVTPGQRTANTYIVMPEVAINATSPCQTGMGLFVYRDLQEDFGRPADGHASTRLPSPTEGAEVVETIAAEGGGADTRSVEPPMPGYQLGLTEPPML